VLGVGLVFVVVVGSALQAARRRADEAWEGAQAHLQDSGWSVEEFAIRTSDGRIESFTETGSDNYLSAVRECVLSDGECGIALSQTRTLFGYHIEVTISDTQDAGLVDAARDALAVVGVELTVVPFSSWRSAMRPPTSARFQ